MNHPKPHSTEIRVSWKNAFFLLISPLLFTACSTQEMVEETPIRPVRYYELETSALQETATFTGVTKSGQEAAFGV